MFFANWMAHLKGEALLTEVAIPGAHNAGSYGMSKMACCQDGDLYLQFLYGVRHFCIRLDLDKHGDLVMCHGLTKGDYFENGLIALRRIITQFPNEFLILDIRRYYTQKIAFLELNYDAPVDKVNALIAKYLEPESYAFCDFEDINTVTVDDIRNSKKRYMLYNDEAMYDYSVNPPYIFPFSKKLHGSMPWDFARSCLDLLRNTEKKGLFWFQIQQTPNLGTKQGLATPRQLEDRLKPLFVVLFDRLYRDEALVKKAGIISGDFMTDNYDKAKRILRLNLMKDLVKEDSITEYESATRW